MNLVRRIGPDPHIAREGEDWDPKTPQASGCPDIWEVEGGDIAFIGRRVSDSDLANLPEGVTCGPDEQMVIVPRRYILRARDDIASLL